AQRRDLALNAEIHGVRVHVLDQVSSISDLLHEHGLGRVDLLKVSDGQRGLELLAGMDAPAWNCVQQVVVDPGGDSGISEAAAEMLPAQGFTVESGGPASEAGVRTVVGLRPLPVAVAARPRRSWQSSEQLRRDLREHLELRLPAFMVPSSLTL